MGRHIYISTTNDIATDNRVHKVAVLLLDLGYEVTWVGRLLSHSQPIERPYAVRRMKCFFNKGGLFYAEFQLRLFFILLLSRPSMLLSNDLDTLLPNYLVSRLLGVELVYDTHEYFCGVPEIQGRWVKKVWQRVERFVFPKLQHIWTVNESIAQLYEADYGLRPRVFRNISPVPEIVPATRAQLGLPEHMNIAINQGSGMNVDRGLEEALEAVAGMENWLLLLVGSGDAIGALKQRVQVQGWEHKVHFVDRVPYAELLAYTQCADVGLSLDKDTNINYRYSLPNKLFDYVHCNLPVVTSKVVEVKRIVESYGIGRCVDPEDLGQIRAALEQISANRSAFDAGLKKAQKELTWELEQKPLRAFYEEFV